MELDKEHGDIESRWNSRFSDSHTTEDLIKQRFRQYITTNAEEVLINDSNTTDPMTTLDGAISIVINKNNTSFDFAEKFKEFLINDDFREKDNLLNFINNSGNDIGRLLYERIQNFIGNNVNVDSCHYLNLISEYKSINIDIDEMFIKGIPDNLHYVINLLSLPKEYYKSLFYNLNISDKNISSRIENIKLETDLRDVNDAINRKYFDNFYENLAYPIICSELFKHKDDEKISNYIRSASGELYKSLFDDEFSEFLFLKLLQYTTTEEGIDRLGQLMLFNFLKENINFVPVSKISAKDVNENNYIEIDYFSTLLKTTVGYVENEAGILPNFDMSSKIFGTPISENINFNQPTYKDIYAMFELYATSALSFIEILNIRLVAKKLANACNSICKLRQEIKLIKEKDSKVGTAVLIEELITDFIAKTLTKKVGLTNQKMVDITLKKAETDLLSLSDDNTEEKHIKDVFSNLVKSEQKIIGIDFEEHLDYLSNIAKKLKIDIIEYYDVTSSYLNIIPEIESVKQKKYYTKRVIQCPPYLNTFGAMVYSDYNSPNTIVEFDNIEEFQEHVHQCGIGTDGTGYTYYFDGKMCDIDTSHGFEQIYVKVSEPILDEDGNQIFNPNTGEAETEVKNYYLVQPENSYSFVIAKNLNRPNLVYSNEYKWYQFEDVDEDGNKVTKIIDTYDRLITWRQLTDVIDNNSNSVISWQDGRQNTPLSYKYIIQNTNTRFTDSYSGIILSASSSKDSYAPVVDDTDFSTGVYYFGLFVRLDTLATVSPDDINMETMTLISDPEINVVWQQCVSIDNLQLADIYQQTQLNVYVKPYGSNEVLDGIGGNSNVYHLYSYWQFKLDDTGELLNCTPDYKIYNSERMVLNYYKSDLEKFYKSANCATVFKNVEIEVIAALDGNIAFWNDLSSNMIYSEKTVDEEADIIRFYNNIGLIDNILPDNYKVIHYDKTEELTKPWINARTTIINKLKNMWAINAPHKWFNKVEDEAQLAEGKIDKEIVNNLKNMDIAYHSNIGADMNYDPKVKLQNSITNLENWENNTVAIHPCVWNLVEKSYDSFIKLYSISLFGEDILRTIYSNAFEWPLIHFGDKATFSGPDLFKDNDGLFSVKKNVHYDESGESVLDSIHVHNADYWKHTAHDMFPYTTDYEASTNEDLMNEVTSRFIDFDGPFNYEALMAIIDKYWDNVEEPSDEIITEESIEISSEEIPNLEELISSIDLDESTETPEVANVNIDSIRPTNINLSCYYIENLIIQ